MPMPADNLILPEQGTFRPLWKSRSWLLVFVLFSIPALISCVLLHTRLLQLGRESNFWIVLIDQLFFWYVWAALTPIIVSLGRKFRLERQAWARPVIAHFLFGTCLAFFQISLSVLFSVIVYGEPITWEHYKGEVVPTLFGRLPTQMLVYATIIGVSYAIEYQRRFNERALKATRLESELSKARLDTLQRQLQPHFLFNTLNSISVLMEKGEIKESNEVLNHLSDLLRQVLKNQEEQEVTLGQELEFVRRYLEIEKIRYGERLKVKMAVDQNLVSCLVPSYLIQLLVENAIRHGIAKKVAGGEVAVTVSAGGGRLILKVEDDGVGLKGEAESSGVGLRNARSRLAHLYGDDYRFEIANNENGGVTALLEIPIIVTAGDKAQ